MTRTGPVGEQPIASADTSAGRLRDMAAVGEGSDSNAADRTAFPELLTRLAAKEAGVARTPTSKERPDQNGVPRHSSAAGWRQMGIASDGVFASGKLMGEGPAASDDIERRGSETSQTSDGAVVLKSNADMSSLMPLQPVLPELHADEVRTLVREADAQTRDNRLGGHAAEPLVARPSRVSQSEDQPLDSSGPARSSADVDVEVFVVRRETHFAPIVLSSLSPRAADRPVTPVAANRSNAGRAGTMALKNPDLSVEQPEVAAAAIDTEAGVEPPASKPNSHASGAQKFDHARAAHGSDAKANAQSGGDGPAGQRSVGGTAAIVEPGAANVAQAQPLPGLSASPIEQIADRITTELRDAMGGAAQPGNDVVSASLSSGAQLRVLHIQLQPADLGAISVRMSLKQDTLELQLEASRHEAAALISRDKDALAGMLKSAGYLIDGLTVQIAGPDRTAAPTGQLGSQGTQANFQASTQSQFGGAQPDARSFSAQQQAQRDIVTNPPNREDNASTQHISRPVDGALYV
jgi:flagellar hook-length control protein FliK